MTSEISTFLETFCQWARSSENIHAAVLVGSYSNETATEHSDVDLVILTADPDTYLRDQSWIAIFGKPTRCQEEDYGRVKSVRVFYEGGLEIEYGFTTLEWANSPIDAGTMRVVSGGMKVLHDPHGRIAIVRREIESGG